MSRHLLAALSTLGLATGVVATSAQAQVVVPDASLEGPLVQVLATPGSGPLGAATVSWDGELTVMGVTVRVLTGATINSSTASLTFDQIGAAPAFPGRSQNGFLGGTAIVTGDSAGGIVYATDVFVEPAENGIVGQATGPIDSNIGINNIEAVPVPDPRLPAGKPINGFGFEINPLSIPANSLLSIEGYYGTDGRLHYHTLEADVGTLVNTNLQDVSVLRAQCRIRGGNRDEMEVRGGTVRPANAAVTIEISNSAGPVSGQDTGFTALPGTATPVVDNTAVPQQGLYRYNRSNLNLPGSVCPAFVRARVGPAAAHVHSAAVAPASR